MHRLYIYMHTYYILRKWEDKALVVQYEKDLRGGGEGGSYT